MLLLLPGVSKNDNGKTIYINEMLSQMLAQYNDKRMIILYAVPISLWPLLGKENLYFYTRHPNNNEGWRSYQK